MTSSTKTLKKFTLAFQEFPFLQHLFYCQSCRIVLSFVSFVISLKLCFVGGTEGVVDLDVVDVDVSVPITTEMVVGVSA